jgi:hypothetical protein
VEEALRRACAVERDARQRRPIRLRWIMVGLILAAAVVLVWQADTRAMNPRVAPEVIAAAYATDEAAAAAEYGAEFRRDIESFVRQREYSKSTPQAVRRCPEQSRLHMPRLTATAPPMCWPRR